MRSFFCLWQRICYSYNARARSAPRANPPKAVRGGTQTYIYMSTLTMDDLVAIRSLSDSKGVSAHEQFDMSERCNRKAGGVAITGLVLASAALLIAIAAWVFAGLFTSARTRTAEAMAQANSTQIAQLANLYAAERTERIAAVNSVLPNISQTVDKEKEYRELIKKRGRCSTPFLYAPVGKLSPFAPILLRVI